MTNAISVEGVSKRFRIYKNRNQSLKGAFLQRSRAQFEEFWALDDVSFEIPQGKTFGLLGHNGSGKSTLLKCIAKILTPDKGTISSTGRMAAMLEVGSGFHPELSGRENIYLNGAILGMSKKEIDSKLDAIIDFSGVERVTSTKSATDEPRRPGVVGLYLRIAISSVLCYGGGQETGPKMSMRSPSAMLTIARLVSLRLPIPKRVRRLLPLRLAVFTEATFTSKMDSMAFLISVLLAEGATRKVY